MTARLLDPSLEGGMDSGTRCRLAQERVKAQRAALRAEVNR